MTQNEEVLQYMKEHRQGISSMVAWKMGITRLAARISDLRDKGYKISSETIKYRNKDGKSKTYALYRLEDDNDLL